MLYSLRKEHQPMRIDKIISFAQEINPVRRYIGLRRSYIKTLESNEKDICKTLGVPDKVYNKYKTLKASGSFTDRIKIFLCQLYADKHYNLLNTSFDGDKKAMAFVSALMQAKKSAATSVFHKTIPYKIYNAVDKQDTGITANIKKAILIPINYLRYLIKSDEKLSPLMAKLTAIQGNGDEFATQAYNLIIKYLKIADRAPKLVIDNTIKSYGDYSTTNNVIRIRTNRKRKDIIRTIRHEIEHFRQADVIIRALGIEEYAKIYPTAKLIDLRTNFAGSIRAPRIKPDQKLLNFIKQCTEAMKNYKQKDTWFDYYLNLTEVNARGRGDLYRKQFVLKDNITFLA